MTRHIGRRSVMALGAMGGLALASGRDFGRTAPITPVRDLPASGVLALWTRIVDDRRAIFGLTGSGGNPAPATPLATATLDVDRIGSVSQVQAAGRRFAVAAVARSWDVAPAACRVDGTTIVHPASGRSVRLMAWTDFCYA